LHRAESGMLPRANNRPGGDPGQAERQSNTECPTFIVTLR
jgi:hypothetical protein